MTDLLHALQLREARMSIKTCIERSYTFLLCIFVDFIFFLLYGLLSAPLFSKLTEHIIILGTFISDQMKNNRGYLNNKSLVDLLLTQPIKQFFLKFLLLLLLLGILAYTLYCLLQSSVWKLTSDLAGYKHPWLPYLRTFSQTNLAWFGIFVLYYFGDLFLSIRATVIQKLDQHYAPSTLWTTIFIALTLLSFYFATLSYIFGSVKNGVKKGVREWQKFLPPILFVFCIFWAINLIMQQSAVWSPISEHLLGFALFLPSLTCAKVYIWRIARH